jgi:hypothetical protein
MKNKALTLTIAMFSLSLILVGCGKSDDKGNSQAAVKVESGSYIVPDSANISQTKGNKGYLALKVQVKNKTDDDIYASGSDFKLIDKDGHKISTKDDVYMSNDDDDFKTFSEKIDGGDDADGYIVFPVDKTAKYTLKYLPDVTSGDSKAIKINVAANKYKDGTKQAQKAVQAYVDTIFLGKSDSNYSKYVANDKNEEKDNFNDKLKDNLDTELSDADLSDDQFKAVSSALEKANADRGSVEYKIESASAESAEISVKVKAIDLDDISDQINDQVMDAIDNGKLDIDANNQEAVNKVVDNIADILKKADVKSESYDTKIKVSKEDGKWKIDSEDNSFDSLYDDFSGQIY